MPSARRLTPLDIFLLDKITNPSPWFPIINGKVYLKDRTTKETFDISAREFVPLVQRCKDERLKRVRNKRLGDPDRWDSLDLERIRELCGYKWAHLPIMKLFHAAVLVRKRGLLEKVDGTYRYGIM